ncbi:MAG: hypothetical protein AB7L66_03080 [Gemmatimonadales bacterium]
MPTRIAVFVATLIPFTILAFWPRYFSRLGEVDGYTHLHASLGGTWLLLLLTQALLMHRGRLAAHRLLGRASYLLGPAFAVSGVLLAHHRFSRMSAEAYAVEGRFLYLPLMVSALFAAAFALGVRWRASRAVHARFMVATAVVLVDPVFGRIMGFYLPPMPDVWYQAITFSTTAAILLGLARSVSGGGEAGRAFRTFAVGATVVLALFFAVPRTGAWLAFGEWFRRLPLT